MLNAPLQRLTLPRKLGLLLRDKPSTYLMFQQVDLELPVCNSRRVRIDRKRKHVVHRTKRVQQRSSAAFIINLLEIVQDLPKLLCPCEGLLLLTYSLLLGFLLLP